VSGKWLLAATASTLMAAALCTWGALCLLFWQGSWQLLYHPVATVATTPAADGLAFEPVAFAVGNDGIPQLTGWWIAAGSEAKLSRLTVLRLHGQDGNLGNSVDALRRLHAAGVNVLAFDYRGYGQSQFTHPSEAHWLQDADWALDYLTATRHVSRASIVLDGEGLGANLALEVAAAHPELAGVIAESPTATPTDAIFDDARAKLVPAQWLVHDRYDLGGAAKKVRVPVLWVSWAGRDGSDIAPAAYGMIAERKTLVWLRASPDADRDFAAALARWFDDLPTAEP